MNSYLETAISLILIFFVFSVIAYVLQELIAVNLQYREKVLKKALSQIFDNVKTKGRSFLTKGKNQEDLLYTDEFYQHAQISSLKKNIERLPAYIPAANFSLALMDLVASKAGSEAPENLFEKVRRGLVHFNASEGDLFKILQNLLETSSDIKELQQKVESWYNQYMDRVTG